VACGGLGYSKYSIFGDHLAINDVNRTYEGDNNVLTQSISKIILKNFSYLMKGKSTHKTCSWMSLEPEPEITSFTGDLKSSVDLIKLLKNRALRQAQKIAQALSVSTLSKHEAWNRM